MSKRGNQRRGGRSRSTEASNAENNRQNGNSTRASPMVSAPIDPQAAVGPNNNHNATKNQQGDFSAASNDALLAKYTKTLSNWTMGLVFVGILTAGVLLLQWHSLERADDTSRAGLRPYISGTGINADIERYPLYWNLSATLENSGGTPPLELRYVIRSSPEFPLDPEEVFQHPSETDAFSERSVAPKGQISVISCMPLSNFFESRKAWYISGAIHYRDQFQGTSEHISKFCFAVVSVKDFKANSMLPGYDACPYWNCIDEKACANDRARYDQAVRSGKVRPTKKSSDTPDIPTGTGIPSPEGMIIKVK
jgi:hypothetical protein